MSDDECIHGLGPIACCTICNGKENAERKARNTIAYAFMAKFEGTLACGHAVDLGEEICRMGDGRIICSDCALKGT